MLLFFLVLFPFLINGRPSNVSYTEKGRRDEKVIQICTVMKRIDRLAEHLDENGEAITEEYRHQQTLLIYKDFDEQLTFLFTDILKLKGVMAASVLLEDRHVAYRNIGTIFEVEQNLKKIANSFEKLMAFQRKATEPDSFQFVIEEGTTLFDELIDCIIAIKTQLRIAISSKSTLKLLPLLRILGSHGEFRNNRTFLPMLILLLVTTVFAAASSETTEIRCKRQFPFLPPTLPSFPIRRQIVWDRIRARITDQRLQHGGIRERVQQRIAELRNATQATKNCFQNEHGYRCCSQKLFTFLGGAFRNPLLERLLARVDLQKIVDKIVELVQKHFDTSFEVIVAPSDFSSKNTFRGDLMCKTKTPTGKTVLVYATPVPYSTQVGVLRRLTEKEVQSKHWGADLFRISEFSFKRQRS